MRPTGLAASGGETKSAAARTKVRGASAPTVIDLFCGAGGLSLGLREAGFRIILAIDHWQPAVATYRRNHGAHVERAAVEPSLNLPTASVLAGGPPCQGFSSAGSRRSDDVRNTLVADFASLVVKHRPTAFLFENVEGFLTGADGKFVFDLLDRVIGAGYRVHLRKINAANYGVPQHRKRVLAIGGLGWSPRFPPSVTAAFGAPGAELGNVRGLPRCPTVYDALQNLPHAVARGNTTEDDCHVFIPLGGEDMRRAEMLAPGQSMRDLPASLWHPSYERRAFRRVQDGTPTERRGGPPAGLRRLHGDEPSKAITGGALRDFLHPSEHRLLTLRECAVLQTFPVDFPFVGSQADRIQQIGNAVPPLLARRVAESLLQDLAHAEPDGGAGRLLSFAPTLSSGASPALQRVVDRVRRKFGSPKRALVPRGLWD